MTFPGCPFAKNIAACPNRFPDFAKHQVILDRAESRFPPCCRRKTTTWGRRLSSAFRQRECPDIPGPEIALGSRQFNQNHEN